MRLLHTKTLKLHEFFGDAIPLYAILSHRWEDCETTFQELNRNAKPDPKLQGWKKVLGCCAKGAEDGFEFVWIDSCCIDKTSSSELSEAINSMYAWYQTAQVCYVYLSDVQSASEDPRQENSDFHNSKWFTRGWTLQELLVPESLVFYDRQWIEIGTKKSLLKTIENITGISQVLNFQGCCIAQKMSWMARRTTTRIEDIAYCMLGLFNVNMPLLYGEGTNAFRRLQIEILSRTNDESIFCWQADDIFERAFGALLAPDPSRFASCGDVTLTKYIGNRQPYAMTNRGLRLEVQVLEKDLDSRNNVETIPLNCSNAIVSSQESRVQTKRRMALRVSANSTSEVLSAELIIMDTQTPNLSKTSRIFYFMHMDVSDKPIKMSDAILIEVLPKSSVQPAYYLSEQIHKSNRDFTGRSLSRWNLDRPGRWVLPSFSRNGEHTALKLSNRTEHALVLVIGRFFDGLRFHCFMTPESQPFAAVKRWARGVLVESGKTVDRRIAQTASGVVVSVALKKGVFEGQPVHVFVINQESKATWVDV